jgi:hypothetical protein
LPLLTLRNPQIAANANNIEVAGVPGEYQYRNVVISGITVQSRTCQMQHNVCSEETKKLITVSQWVWGHSVFLSPSYVNKAIYLHNAARFT